MYRGGGERHRDRRGVTEPRPSKLARGIMMSSHYTRLFIRLGVLAPSRPQYSSPSSLLAGTVWRPRPSRGSRTARNRISNSKPLEMKWLR
ncbi:hypothetical protein J6590_005156 [Homalodisca vitripennis]|nr:hypothetical protein J6590_005156 [Homalodisca vitripennis]